MNDRNKRYRVAIHPMGDIRPWRVLLVTASSERLARTCDAVYSIEQSLKKIGAFTKVDVLEWR